MVNLHPQSTLLGAVILARHGDRLEFFQDPLTYTPSATSLTPLGTVQELQLGSFLRATYLDPTNPSTFIAGISPDLVDIAQVIVRADAAGEGSVIQESVNALLQGLYPPTPSFSITLANGTNVVGAMGGYQYVPVESVQPNLDISLNSFTSCPNFDLHTQAFYNSDEFKAKAQAAAPFLQALKPYVGNRSLDFINMFNIFDFVNVEMIHNKTFLDALPATFAAQAYALANYHENGVFTDGKIDGIGNVAIQTILPSIFSSLTRIANQSDPLKLALNEISYKPFISLFNITAATEKNPEIAGIVDYTSVVSLELRASPAGPPMVTMRFKNGTAEHTFRPLSIFGKADIPLSEFIGRLAPAAINSTSQWCQACNQHVLRGCSGCV
ncbi:phosphoglycerate mutase-like protein [Mycena rosella]|uniref:Phosphoglycerate mutase-like protein n=1 Tax=Mycena rosella TaxID=1033263 RepID=A0AAD7GB49_MYCRO|nr:phosphoglycerate mutase-like protein [Mycena rosella]